MANLTLFQLIVCGFLLFILIAIFSIGWKIEEKLDRLLRYVERINMRIGYNDEQLAERLKWESERDL